MDEFLILILVLVVIAAIISAIVLPIIALVISIRSKKKLAERISRLEAGQSPGVSGAPPISSAMPFAALVQQLTVRVARLEAALTARSIPFPEVFDERSKVASEQTARQSAQAPVPLTESSV